MICFLVYFALLCSFSRSEICLDNAKSVIRQRCLWLGRTCTRLLSYIHGSWDIIFLGRRSMAATLLILLLRASSSRTVIRNNGREDPTGGLGGQQSAPAPTCRRVINIIIARDGSCRR